MEAREFFHGGFCPEYVYEKTDNKATAAGDHFIVEDLLDFSNDDAVVTDGTFDTAAGNSIDSSTVTVVDSCNSSFSGGDQNFVGSFGCRNFSDGHFSSDQLCVPNDDLAELEWLSNFAEDSFSSEDLQKLQLISGMKARTYEASETSREFQPEPTQNSPSFHHEMSVPAKARSKRSRAAPCNWTSRLLVLSQNTASPEPEVRVQAPVNSGKTTIKESPRKDCSEGEANDGRRCLHCATDKTPQWRAGPMGPKTLCNACGVRYKSGRLVPEYRPAASPTFVLTKHSNSHRKVLELRRQKELEMAQQQQEHQHAQFLRHQQNMAFDVNNGKDYLINQHVGPSFRHLI
ncbi:GATA transcription factor 9-like [Juglans microcarpa x Juglans regia]|uniref:GATA transcription factor 9-like n=1 Tax=Juglans microcarpa x Juglans regia TaxID=2249226 RepID=UPI001B7E62BB|nr:GATA transcription factor 9-like [Juglans microcarpa x Juglans regia]